MKPCFIVAERVCRLSVVAGALLAGCMMDPPGPSPIYSRLPAAQTQPPQPLSKEEQERYNQIDRQALAEQQQAMAADAAAQACVAVLPGARQRVRRLLQPADGARAGEPAWASEPDIGGKRPELAVHE